MTGTDSAPSERRGDLRIYLGAAPGVGKTYAMLEEARRRSQQGVDVVVGVVQTYGRADTEALLTGLEIVSPARIPYRGGTFDELDLDAVLARRPQIALVDELAHTDVPGCRNRKRWQDVEELLRAGIDVYSTVNIQHLDSLNDVVERITGIEQHETVPDAVVRAADQIDMVDITPEELRNRLAEGKVYAPERIDAAMSNYFREGNLTALRELALLWLADQVDMALDKYRVDESITDIWETRERVVVAVTGGPESERLIHRAARIASRSSARLMVVHVVTGDGLVGASTSALAEIRRIAEGLQAGMHSIVGDDVAQALLEFARSVDATQLVLGSSHRPRLSRLIDAGIGERVIRDSGQIDVHIVTHARSAPSGPPGGPGARARIALGWGAVLVLLAVLALLVTVTRDVTTVVLLVAAVTVTVLLAATFARGRTARRATQEAQLLTLFAGSVLRGTDLSALLERVRETYGQRGVSVIRRGRGPVCAVGERPPQTTDTADTVCDVGAGEYVLALSGRQVAVHDRRVLTAIAHQAVALHRQHQLIEEASEARALAAADRLRRAVLSGVSHDLRTPLNTLESALARLRAHWPGELSAGEADELLAAAAESTDRLVELVDDLVDSSRLAAGEVRPRLDRVPVADAVDRTLAATHCAVPSLQVDVDGVAVRADPGLLDRVLGILVSNALRHSTGRPVRIVAARVGNQSIITVADAGPGIPPGRESHVFDPSRRPDEGREATDAGLGLGLWVARGFVEAMGGTAAATATPGGGLTVVVTLPGADTEADAPDGPDTASPNHLH